MSSLLDNRAFMRHFDQSKVEAKQQMNCMIDGIYAQMLVNLREWFRKDNRNDELDNVTTNESNLPLIENPLEVNPNDVNDLINTNETNESNCHSPLSFLSIWSPSNSTNDVNIVIQINDNFEVQSELTQEDSSSQSSIIVVYDSRCTDCSLQTSPNDDQLLNQNNEIDDNNIILSQNERQTKSSEIDKHADDYDEESDEALEPETEIEFNEEISTPKKRAQIQNSVQSTGQPQQKCLQSKQFENCHQLQVHLEVHELNSIESNSTTPFQCEHCGVGFNQKGKLNQHLVKHSDERPYWCDQCEWRFKRRKDLQNLKVHNRNEVPPECNVNMMEMLSQSEEATVGKPFGCHYCTISFLYEDTRKTVETDMKYSYTINDKANEKR